MLCGFDTTWRIAMSKRRCRGRPGTTSRKAPTISSWRGERHAASSHAARIESAPMVPLTCSEPSYSLTALAEAGLRARPRGWHCPGLRDHRRHRLRGALGLWRHRHRYQSGRPPLRRGQGRPDSRLLPRRGRPRGIDRARGGGKAPAEGVPQTRPYFQRTGVESVCVVMSVENRRRRLGARS
jgi:hypothetical protein